jgi:membrane protease YdiL (CAAX protease family)
VVIAIAAVSSVRDQPGQREKTQEELGGLAAVVPRSDPELALFLAATATAAFCEEFLYRGYLIWALAPWLGWWGAASAAAALYGALNARNGWSGCIRTGLVGFSLTLAASACGTLFLAMALHAIMDVGAGVTAWMAFREAGPKRRRKQRSRSDS